MKNQWRLFIGLFLSLIILVFAAMNMANVEIDLGFATFTIPLVILFFISVFLGALLSTLTLTGVLWKQKRTIKQLTKQQEFLDAKIEEEVSLRVAAYLASTEVDQVEEQNDEEQLIEENQENIY